MPRKKDESSGITRSKSVRVSKLISLICPPIRNPSKQNFKYPVLRKINEKSAVGSTGTSYGNELLREISWGVL